MKRIHDKKVENFWPIKKSDILILFCQMMNTKHNRLNKFDKHNISAEQTTTNLWHAKIHPVGLFGGHVFYFRISAAVSSLSLGSLRSLTLVFSCLPYRELIRLLNALGKNSNLSPSCSFLFF